MPGIKENIKVISKLINDVTATARDVNNESHSRKNITSHGLQLADKLIDGNKSLISNFDAVSKNLKLSYSGIVNNSEKFNSNIEHFLNSIKYINNIKTTLKLLNDEIVTLTGIVNEIRDDTDEIFTLALNASIVSSKYSHTSGVFDILANKLDEMSNFINRNLDNIVEVVKPITNGIEQLMNENAVVQQEVEKEQKHFMTFPDLLDGQKESINNLLKKAEETNGKIQFQRKMLEDITEQFILMDADATKAIDGSGNVIHVGEDLISVIDEIDKLFSSGQQYDSKIAFIRDQSYSIWHSAQNVNEKSKSQLDFSLNTVEFFNQIISESELLKNTASIFNSQSSENSKTADLISHDLLSLGSQLKIIEGKIVDSSKTIIKFNDDYKQIDSILEFLKNILKSMKIIGMLSRIESSRDPEEFHGFMTISENINKLQDKIQNNIPLIEENINHTYELITSVNDNFESMTGDFKKISEISDNIINKLGEITEISITSEEISTSIYSDSEKLEKSLGNLRDLLNTLINVVEKPIEGSASNIERGKKIESICNEILDCDNGTLNTNDSNTHFEERNEINLDKESLPYEGEDQIEEDNINNVNQQNSDDIITQVETVHVDETALESK